MQRGRSRKKRSWGSSLENRNWKLENGKRGGRWPPFFVGRCVTIGKRGVRRKARRLCHTHGTEAPACGLLGIDVEAVASLDFHVLLLHDELEFVIADGGVGLVGGIAEDILVVEFLVEVGIDFVEGLFLRNLKETPAGSFGDLLENFLAVGTRFFGAPGIAAASSAHSAATTHPTPAHARPSEPASVAVAFFLVGEEDAVDEAVGALGGFEGFAERFLATVVDAIGEDDERFAALLLFHQFAGGEVNGVVKESAAAVTVAVRAVTVAAPTATGRAPAGAGPGELWRVELVDGGEKFLA